MTSLMASSPAGWDDRWGRLKEGFVGGKSGVGAAQIKSCLIAHKTHRKKARRDH